jgi:hypothetical protein
MAPIRTIDLPPLPIPTPSSSGAFRIGDVAGRCDELRERGIGDFEAIDIEALQRHWVYRTLGRFA